MAAMFLRFYIGIVLILAFLVACSTPPEPTSKKTTFGITKIPEDNSTKGLVYKGLRLGTKGGPCEGMLELDLPNKHLCTHGPDAAPPGLDVTVKKELSTSSLAALATSPSVPCIGDGSSGNRVQAIYAVASDQPDRFNDVAPLIAGWAGTLDSIINASANQVGGERHVRFVTDANCKLVVKRVVVSPSAAADFAAMISEMTGLGYNNPSRKYLVWMDANLYCGIAQVYSDDKPTADNMHNGRYPMFARVDRGCWDGATSTAVHELVHTLGGVQPTAPHGSSRYHCTDDYDRLCYNDGSGLTVTYPCPSGNEAYLDCNHDDYFHTNPPVGSYLATHWNVANSSFLEGGIAPLPNQAPVVNAGADQSVKVGTVLQLSGSVSDDGLPSPSLTLTWTKASGPGTVIFANAASASTTATFSAAGTYVLTLGASDGALSSSDSVTITVTSVTTTTTFSSSLSKRTPSRNFALTVGSGAFTATSSFSSGKLINPQLTLELFDSAGKSVGRVTGPSGTALTSTITAGNYALVVTGSYVSFSLSVTHPRP